jgi:hypothetical protein
MNLRTVSSKSLAAITSGILLTGVNALALTDGPYSASFPVGGGSTALDFSSSMTIPKFNVAGGTLTSVTFTLTGNLTANQDFENRSASSATVTMTSTGTMTLKRPDTTTLVVTIPVVTNSKAVAAFDGINDSAGTSGFTFPATSTSLAQTTTYSGASDLALFSGAGTISLPLTAAGVSSGTGAANLSTAATMVGSASATVTYTYSTAAPVPEASTYGAIGAVSFVGFIGYRRSRRAAASVKPTV